MSGAKSTIQIAILVLAVASAVGVTLFFARSQIRQSEVDLTLKPVAALLDDNRKLLESLAHDGFAERAMLDTFLDKIRQDGVAKYAADKHSIDLLNGNNLVAMALLSQYLPYTRSPQFKASAESFNAYASSFRDRWAAVFEVFMAGGDLPPVGATAPTGFERAIAAEETAHR